MGVSLSRRAVLAFLVVVLAAVAARGAVPSSKGSTGFSGSIACGVERWAVKTLQDRPELIRAQATTVAHLDSLPRPSLLPPTRLQFEHHIFSIAAAVTLDRPEADMDLHLVLQSGESHMIAEAPSPACTTLATPFRRRQMKDARSVVRVCARARVVGVAFFDFKHGQTGVAPNAIELHPILGFACLSG